MLHSENIDYGECIELIEDSLELLEMMRNGTREEWEAVILA